MSLIDQLDQTVSTAVLGDDNNVSHLLLLEQFYAIFIMRLAQPAVYSQLLRGNQQNTLQATLITSAPSATLFEQLWIVSLRQLLIDELATTHHVDTHTTEKLLINAAPLAYQELKNLANGQFLPAFLQEHQASLRPHLPVWAEEVISSKIVNNEKMYLNKNTFIDKKANNENPSATLTVPHAVVEQAVASEDLTSDQTERDEAIVREQALGQSFLTDTHTTAIHANPSDYYDVDTSTSRLKVRARNQKNDLIVRALLLIGALAAMGLLWILVIEPNYMTPAEPMVTTPIVTAPPSAPVAKASLPAELIMGVDDSGQLYSCTATVGDSALQSALTQALNVSFGDQANTCELTIKPGVADSLSGINIETLPNIFTLLRSVPFARLQLQNDRLTLEAPDALLLQQLLTDMQTLVPTLSMTTAAPLPLRDNNGPANDNNMQDSNNEFSSQNIPLDNTYDNTYPNTRNELPLNQNYQEADDNVNDVLEAAPLPNNNPTSVAPVGSMSASEVDNLAKTTIVAEKLRNERPVDKNLTTDK